MQRDADSVEDQQFQGQSENTETYGTIQGSVPAQEYGESSPVVQVFAKMLRTLFEHPGKRVPNVNNLRGGSFSLVWAESFFLLFAWFPCSYVLEIIIPYVSAMPSR